MNKNILGIIPARYASTRFPGKPLVKIKGRPMIQRVYEQSMKARYLSGVLVATDDARIAECVEGFGGNYVLTSEEHQTGTDRCAEAYSKTNKRADAIINIQGDEPFIDPNEIDKLAACLLLNDVQIATLARPIVDIGELGNPNVVKVIMDKTDNALYFSRSAIPYLEHSRKIRHQYYAHIGLYGFLVKTLKEITSLPPTSLELAEHLEQLRWMENGYKIKVKISENESVSIDTPEDLEKLT